MKKLFFCGHTGSMNRGCEAIVRSSARLFSDGGYKQQPILATFNRDMDTAAGLDKITELLPYGSYSSKMQRLLSAFGRIVLRNSLSGQSIIQHNLWQKAESGDLCLNIGGDTYCYSTPTVSLALNLALEKKGVASVLWCCSVERSAISGKVLADLKRYDLIVARESITRNALEDSGIDPERLLLCCDPAFRLEAEQTQLPLGFIPKNTVGINVSSLVNTPQVMSGIKELIERIIGETDMSVCLIPHVYSTNGPTGDLQLLSGLYDLFKDNTRVSIVDRELSCCQLKYIISQCRFFVGARTHSIIAAYSSAVPALALGYSVKALGIATDLFGTENSNVLAYQRADSAELYRAFAELMQNEQTLRKLYAQRLDGYMQTVDTVVRMIFNRYLGE